MGGKIEVAEADGRPHGFDAAACEPIESAVLDLGDETVAAEFGDQAGGPVGAASGFGIVSGWGSVDGTSPLSDDKLLIWRHLVVPGGGFTGYARG